MRVNAAIHSNLLLRAIRAPQEMLKFSPEDWSQFLLAARLSTLLPRLSHLARRAGIWENLPPKVRDHMRGGEINAEFSRTRLIWETSRIARAFFDKPERIILLKGGAYAFADLPCAKGRVSSDIDIMVAKDHISAVEQTLKAHGWQPVKQDAYDDEYYRNWMHELPPLQHPGRGMIIDVHHTIIPLTSRLKPDAGKLIEAATAIDDRFSVLAPDDMVLHSAVHLFYDGDLSGGLRDLYDIHELLGHFGKEAGFWDKLIARAIEQGLTRPLFYCCRYAEALLGTEIPAPFTKALEVGSPAALILFLMDRLAVQALVPDSIFYPRGGRALPCFLMYLRSHWLRMPPLMLARHLGTKAYMRFKYPLTSAPVPEANQQIDG
jgi:hypothetical protein